MLQIDDISIGMYITVVTRNNKNDMSFMGDVLVVEAINLPYIIVNKLNDPPLYHKILDTRKVTLGKLSSEYIKALLSEEQVKKLPSFQKSGKQLITK